MKYTVEVTDKSNNKVIYNGEGDKFYSFSVVTTSNKEVDYQHCVIEAVQLIPDFTLSEGYNSNTIKVFVRITCPKGCTAIAKLENGMLWIEPIKEVVHV